MRLVFNFLFFLLFFISNADAKRVALIIGNANYKTSPLVNPINDARAFEAKLKVLGFGENIIKRENLKKGEIGEMLRQLRSKVSPGDDVIVFYAGHGLQVKGVNYLPAVDADIESEEDVALNSISLPQLLDRLDDSKAGMKLVFLDACRNNPFSRGFRSLDRGLAKVGDAPSGTLISFATRPGSVAADGDGKNGTYTSHLLKHMDLAGVTIEQLLKKVAIGVENETNGKQEPWIEGSIKGDFYFNTEKPVNNFVIDEKLLKIENEKGLWNLIKNSEISQPFKEYVKQFPDGLHKSEAEKLIIKFDSIQVKKAEDSEDVKLWQAAEIKNLEEDYAHYISVSPAGKYVGLAKAKILKIQQSKELEEWNSAFKSNQQGALEAYIKKYTEGLYSNVAREKLKEIVENNKLEQEVKLWSSASSKAQLNMYIIQYPKGKFVNEAKNKLTEMESIESKNIPEKPYNRNTAVVPSIM